MKNTSFRAVILAGGSGERFWPLSTPEKPKQFLRVFGGESLIRQCFLRLKGLVRPEDVFVVTAKALVAATRAIAAGATIVNCVYPGPVPEMLKLLDAHPGVELVLPVRNAADLAPSAAYLPRLYLDPMVGFGTTREEDLALLRGVADLADLAKLGRVLVGASRKRIVKRLTGTKVPGKDLAGNLAIALWAAQNGAAVVRVHDVRETVQALKVRAVLSGEADA